MESEYQLSLIPFLSGINANAPDFKAIIELSVLALLLFGSAMLSASEVAYFSFRPEDIRRLRSEKSKRAKTAIKLYNNPEKLLSTIIVANNTLNIAIIFLVVFISLRLFDPGSGKLAGFIISMAVISFLLLLFGEVMPKVYASGNQRTVALYMAYPLTILQKIFSPVTSMLIFATSFVRKRHGTGNGSDDHGVVRGEGNMDEDEKILKGIANFGSTYVSAIMCPRIDVTALDIKSGFDKIIPVIINSGFSRIPVYSGSFDTVRGILYAKDVLPYTNNPANFKWQSLLRPSYFVPETKKINDLLKEFQLRKIHMAIVIDEYGGTSGIVTLEDILEEIVGDITDESDEDQTYFRKLDETKYIFDGKILLNDFCKVYGIEEDVFDEVRGESETLAGLMLELTGEIPQKDQVIKYSDFIFRIESVDRRRIKEIHVENIKKNEGIEKT